MGALPMRFRSIKVASILLLGLSLPHYAAASESESWRDVIPKPYHDEGLFVEVPAFAGGAVGLVAGVVIGLPPAVVAGVAGGVVDFSIFVSSGGTQEGSYSFMYGKTVHGFIARSCMNIGLYTVGAPFYILKKVLIDLPQFLVFGPPNELTPIPNGYPRLSSETPSLIRADLQLPLANKVLEPTA
jgi:hypothetical protein